MEQVIKSYQNPSLMNRAYIGYGNPDQCGYRYLFTNDNVMFIQQEINKQLKQLIKKNIIVVKEQIVGILSQLMNNNNPIIGDIQTRLLIPSAVPRNDVDSITQQCINIIVANIVDEERMRAYNESLTIWTTNYGDFNKHGLRRHSVLKMREKDVKRGQFNMKY